MKLVFGIKFRDVITGYSSRQVFTSNFCSTNQKWCILERNQPAMDGTTQGMGRWTSWRVIKQWSRCWHYFFTIDAVKISRNFGWVPLQGVIRKKMKMGLWGIHREQGYPLRLFWWNMSLQKAIEHWGQEGSNGMWSNSCFLGINFQWKLNTWQTKQQSYSNILIYQSKVSSFPRSRG